MPSAQVIDLNPGPRGPATPLEKTLSAFASRNTADRADARETDALREIYDEYRQDGANLERTIKGIQTKPGLSPTTRVNTIDQLLKFQQHNTALQKQAEKQQKQIQKENDKSIKDAAEKSEKEAEQQRAEAALRKSGATEEQIALFNASPVGGQTKVIGNVLETTGRNQPSPPEFADKEITDYDAKLLPAERVKRQDARFSLQTPLVTKNSESLRGLQGEELSLGLLTSLEDTGKLGKGLHKLNINPKTGDLLIPQLANAEEQLFAKTVNDFTVKAKDSFGARVTNFELDRFMQRLPTLANSPEGRKLIISHMSIVNKAQQLEKKALQDVFDKYGVRNIDFVEAENLARKSIEKEAAELRKQAMQVEQMSREISQEQAKAIKAKVQPGYTALIKPDGTIKQFPDKNIPNLEEKGYKRL